MFVGGEIGNVWNDPEEEKFFYQGYGEMNIDKSLIAYYRFEPILQDIAEYGNEVLYSHGNHKNKAQLLQYFIDLFEPTGVIDMAFAVDEML